jgi:transposase
MPAPYSYDLRQKLIEAIERGMSIAEAARVFNVSRNTIYQWRKRQSATGDLKATTAYQHGWGHKITDWESLRQFAQAQGEKTQAEMAQAWSERISQRTLSRALKKIGFTRKKNLRLPRKES